MPSNVQVYGVGLPRKPSEHFGIPNCSYFMVPCSLTSSLGSPNRATLQGGRNELWERGNSHSYTHISSRRISPSFSIYPSSYTLSSQFSIPTSLHKHIIYTETCPNIGVKTSRIVKLFSMA